MRVRRQMPRLVRMAVRANPASRTFPDRVQNALTRSPGRVDGCRAAPDHGVNAGDEFSLDLGEVFDFQCVSFRAGVCVNQKAASG